MGRQPHSDFMTVLQHLVGVLCTLSDLRHAGSLSRRRRAYGCLRLQYATDNSLLGQGSSWQAGGGAIVRGTCARPGCF